MKKTIKNTAQKAITSFLILGLCFTTATFADGLDTFTMALTSASTSVELVQGDGSTAANTSLAFDAKNFSFSQQTSTAKLGDDTKASALDQVIKLSNPTDADWTLALDFNGNTYWNDGATQMPANGTTSTGLLSVNPSGCSIESSVGGTSLITANVVCAAADDFNGVTSVPLASGSLANAEFDEFFITDIALTQYIPAAQAVVASGYSIAMNLTFTN